MHHDCACRHRVLQSAVCCSRALQPTQRCAICGAGQQGTSDTTVTIEWRSISSTSPLTLSQQITSMCRTSVLARFSTCSSVRVAAAVCQQRGAEAAQSEGTAASDSMLLLCSNRNSMLRANRRNVTAQERRPAAPLPTCRLHCSAAAGVHQVRTWRQAPMVGMRGRPMDIANSWSMTITGTCSSAVGGIAGSNVDVDCIEFTGAAACKLQHDQMRECQQAQPRWSHNLLASAHVVQAKCRAALMCSIRLAVLT